MSTHLPENLFEAVERIARELPQVPRLAILDALDAEWSRLHPEDAPHVAPLVTPAALWRLRLGSDRLTA